MQVFYNLIFMDKLYTKKYLFYNCYVNSCYCVVRVAFNLSICREDMQGIQKQYVLNCAHHLWKPLQFVSVSVFQR